MIATPISRSFRRKRKDAVSSSVRKMELIGPSSRDVRGKQDYGLSGMKSKRRGGGGEEEE